MLAWEKDFHSAPFIDASLPCLRLGIYFLTLQFQPVGSDV